VADMVMADMVCGRYRRNSSSPRQTLLSYRIVSYHLNKYCPWGLKYCPWIN